MTNSYYKDALKQFKKRYPATQELKNHHKSMTVLLRKVKKAVEEGLSTVPEIAESIEERPHRVVFAINALRRWQGVEITNKRGEFPQYGVKSE